MIKLKRWVEILLMIIETILLFMIIGVIEKSMVWFIINKVVEVVLFIAISEVLFKYSRLFNEE